ncbi:trypsin-like serine peptidase [Streptomyces cyaneus]|uniref:trypsin-like serine peptidase n=1 Tax=Streptomyces cyaneus TaxID=1904 RepID=UPI000FF8ABC1|nr:trypsin-like peptidase domain-containing protein [Streptomyces cyaneus]
MKRTSRISRLYLYAAGLLLALTSASVAAADAGAGPFGVTAVAVATGQSARVGALFAAGDRAHLRGSHFCTASVVRSPHHDLIVTAAHCLAGRTDALVFVPGYRDGEAPYGVWQVGRRFLPDGWAQGQDEDEDSDVAFAVVGRREEKGVEDVVGGNRFVTGTATGATAVTVTGYPNSREAPVSCSDKPRLHSRMQQRIACPGFSGGTSGSPWVNGDGEVVGVLGGHEGGGATADVSYSVVLGAQAAALYRQSAGCTAVHVGSS